MSDNPDGAYIATYVPCIEHANRDEVIARLAADRDAWRDALRHVACRLGGTGAGSPDDVRLACDDLIAQDDDRIAAGEDYQRERDELRAVLDGSDVPPSDEAIEAVYRDGGLCVIGSLDGGVLAANSPELAREIARRHRERPSNSWRWTAVGADARPRAWPVAPAVTP